MKKILIVFLILILLLIINVDNTNTITVFDETLELSNLYEITFANSLSTNNFLNYFSDIKVIWIKPKMNILYENQLNKYNKYFFKETTNEKNINNFKKEYINYINNLGYRVEALKLQTSGIMIEKIKVYITSEQLSYIKKVFVDIKLENVV